MNAKIHNKSRIIDITAFLLTVFVATLTSIFVIRYCSLFDDFGLMAKQRLLDNPLLTFFVTPALFWISAYMCRLYSPKASGNHLQSAIIELKKDPNDFDKVATFLNIRLVMVKAFSSLIASFGGGALGKEGPSVHMSAGIFATLAEKYKRFLPDISLATWVSAGTGAGLAIAFNAPIAGIVFVVEKISKARVQNTKIHIIWTLVIISIITIIFHKPQPLFNFHSLIFRIGNESSPLIALAIISGILAFFFQAANNYFYIRFSQIKSNWWHLIPIIAGIVVAYLNFFCGIYSFSGGIATSQEVLSNSANGTIILSYKEVFGRILNTIITFVSGCAGGLIAPALAIGAGIGSIANTFVSNIDLGIFLLIGMASFLAAVLGEPITAAIVVYEATGQGVENIPFLIGAAVISIATFRTVTKLQKRK